MKKIEIKKEKILELKVKRYSVPEMLKELGVSYAVLYKRCKEYGIFIKTSYKFDKINKAKFLELYHNGYNDCQISKLLQVDHRRIQEYRVKLELKSNLEKDFTFTDDQLQIFLGGMLGDSYLGIPNDSKNAYFTFRHSLAQEWYCLWKYSKMKEFCFRLWYSSQYDTRTNKTYSGVTIKSFQNKLFTEYLDKFYHIENGKKVKYINSDILDQLTPLGLAIWFMDDGYKVGNSVGIATNCFNSVDLLKIQNFFLHKYQIKITICKNHELYIPTRFAKIFCSLIEPFIHEDCKYKIKWSF